MGVGYRQLVVLRGPSIALFDMVDGKLELITTCELYATGRDIAVVHFDGG